MGPILFSLFINDLPLHVKDISVDCDIVADDTTLHTSGKDIMQIRTNMQDSLDQVSNWCDNNHMVINPIKTKSMTIATRQKHQLSPLPLDLILNGAKIDQESEHRLLGITMDNTLRWDLHTNNDRSFHTHRTPLSPVPTACESDPPHFSFTVLYKH